MTDLSPESATLSHNRVTLTRSVKTERHAIREAAEGMAFAESITGWNDSTPRPSLPGGGGRAIGSIRHQENHKP